MHSVLKSYRGHIFRIKVLPVWLWYFAISVSILSCKLPYILQTILHTILHTISSPRWTFLSSAPSTSAVLSIQAMRTKRGRSRRTRRRSGGSRRRGWWRKRRIVLGFNKN